MSDPSDLSGEEVQVPPTTRPLAEENVSTTDAIGEEGPPPDPANADYQDPFGAF